MLGVVTKTIFLIAACVQAIEFTHYADMNCSGAVPLLHESIDLQACMMQCEDTTLCQGLSYDTTSGQCFMHSVVNVSQCEAAVGLDTFIQIGAQIKWKFVVGYIPNPGLHFSPAVIGEDSTVYVGSEDHGPSPPRPSSPPMPPHYIYAVARDGAQKWNFTAGGNATHYVATCPPLVGDNDTVFSRSWSTYNDQTLHAFHNNGTQKWNRAGLRDGAVVGKNGVLYASVANDNLKDCGSAQPSHPWSCVAVAALSSNGDTLWTFATDDPACPPDVEPAGVSVDFKLTEGQDGTLFAVKTAQCGMYVIPIQTLYALTAEGKIKWSKKSGGAPLATGADGTMFEQIDGCLHAFDQNGNLKWKFAPPKPNSSKPLTPPWFDNVAVDAHGNVFVTASSSIFDQTGYEREFVSLHALDKHGTEQWSTDSRSNQALDRINTLALGIDNELYIGTRQGALHAVDSNGKKMWSSAVGPNAVGRGPTGIQVWQLGGIRSITVGNAGELYVLAVNALYTFAKPSLRKPASEVAVIV